MAVIGATFLVPDAMSEEILPQFRHTYYSPVQCSNVVRLPNGGLSYCYDGTLPPENADLPRPPPPFIPREDDPPVQQPEYQPMGFFQAEPDDITILTVQKQTDLVENKRYPTHLASFVLAWTRAFVSEWANFLYESDRGLRLERRLLKSVYGDTDSLFLTAEGRRWMEDRGRHRIKKNRLGGLVFDPEKPALTWLVECETVCPVCGADAYSPSTVFLAPKVYALREVICTADPSHRGRGKLRAKGHAASQLNYELLATCYQRHELEEDPEARFVTSRVALKRTLASLQANAIPFSVLETRLTRVLQPWKDRTLAPLTPDEPHLLVPYSNSQPNPRIVETQLMPNELANAPPDGSGAADAADPAHLLLDPVALGHLKEIWPRLETLHRALSQMPYAEGLKPRLFFDSLDEMLSVAGAPSSATSSTPTARCAAPSTASPPLSYPTAPVAPSTDRCSPSSPPCTDPPAAANPSSSATSSPAA